MREEQEGRGWKSKLSRAGCGPAELRKHTKSKVSPSGGWSSAQRETLPPRPSSPDHITCGLRSGRCLLLWPISILIVYGSLSKEVSREGRRGGETELTSTFQPSPSTTSKASPTSRPSQRLTTLPSPPRGMAASRLSSESESDDRREAELDGKGEGRREEGVVMALLACLLPGAWLGREEVGRPGACFY